MTHQTFRMSTVVPNMVQGTGDTKVSKTKHGPFIISRQAQLHTTEKPKPMKVRSSRTEKRCPALGVVEDSCFPISPLCRASCKASSSRSPHGPREPLALQPWCPLFTLLGHVEGRGRRVHHPSHSRRPPGGPQNTLAKVFLSRTQPRGHNQLEYISRISTKS